MPPSAAFRFGSQAVGVKYSSSGGPVAATLDDLAGVNQVTWEVVGTDETTSPGDFVLTISGPFGSVCTLTPAGAGTAGGLLCKVSGAMGNAEALAKWFVPTGAGHEVAYVGEEMESDPLYGSTAETNAAIRAIGAGSGSTPSSLNKAMTASATAADGDLACATALAATPKGYVVVMVGVGPGGGLPYPVGDGVKTRACYFSGDGGTTARAMAAIVATDLLYWVGSAAGFQLTSGHVVDVLFNA